MRFIRVVARARALTQNPIRAQRPILRRVFEGDSPAAVPMCLLVSGIRAKPMAPEQPPQEPRGSVGDPVLNGAGDAGGLMFELELSDGALLMEQ